MYKNYSVLPYRMRIGIITAPSIHRGSNLKKEYIEWIQQGAIPVVVPYDLPRATLKTYLDHLNGLLWVGGSIENEKTHSQEQYVTLSGTYEYCYEYAKEQCDQGNPYPIWGTCLGYYYLVLLTTYRLKDHYFTHVQKSHKIGEGPLVWIGQSRMRNALQKLKLHGNVVTHFHELGFHTLSKDLSKEIRIVATDKDNNGESFITAIEYKDYPFYGSQFHPEQPKHELSRKVSTCLLQLYISECKKNKNHWIRGLKNYNKAIYIY